MRRVSIGYLTDVVPPPLAFLPQSTIATIKSKKKKLRKSWADALIVLELDAEDKAVVCAVNPFVVRFIEFMVAIK